MKAEHTYGPHVRVTLADKRVLSFKAYGHTRAVAMSNAAALVALLYGRCERCLKAWPRDDESTVCAACDSV